MDNLKISDSKVTLVDLVAEKLLNYFKEKNLVPGDSIPTEMELTEALGVGRSVLRESLSRFRMLGLIQSRTRRGMVLSEPDMLGGLDKVVEPTLMSLKSIKEILGLRIALELGSIHLIFRHVTEDDILDLENIVNKYNPLENNRFAVEADHEFHARLTKITGNKLISKYQDLFYKVFVFVDDNFQKYFQKTNTNLQKDGYVTHRDLLEKLRNKDQNGFYELMQKHLELYSDFIDS